MSKPTVVLLGSKPAATVALEVMLQRGWRIEAVVPSGQGVHDFISGDRVWEVAQRNGIPVVKQAELSTGPVDFVISYMFRYRVKPVVLGLAKRAAVNFHAGPLPEYGGWAFYNLAIVENASSYGCTCHHMDDGFDTGPLLEVRRFGIDASKETAWSLERRAQEEMIRLFVDFCSLAESGRELPRIVQDRGRMRYMDQATFERLKEIPLDADDETIQRLARAFFYPPYECAYMNIGGSKVEVLPRQAKQVLAERLHSDDLQSLRQVAAKQGAKSP